MNDFDKKYKVLDTVNQWIFNCDTKVSIILATFGVFFSIILSSDIGIAIKDIIIINVSTKSLCSIAYLLFLVIGLAFLSIGIYKLIKVLLPTINLNHKSVMFFGNVASYPSFNDYSNEVTSQSDNQIQEDILHQIFAASKICDQKFKNQKQGLISSTIGLIIVLIWLIVGFVMYYI